MLNTAGDKIKTIKMDDSVMSCVVRVKMVSDKVRGELLYMQHDECCEHNTLKMDRTHYLNLHQFNQLLSVMHRHWNFLIRFLDEVWTQSHPKA